MPSVHGGRHAGGSFAQHAGLVIVCDGTKEADERLKRVLTNDPMMGIFRQTNAKNSVDLRKAYAILNGKSESRVGLWLNLIPPLKERWRSHMSGMAWRASNAIRRSFYRYPKTS
ncbi:MAG: hypothetical protein IID30_14105 [Planctomycetes bacterium]|nr:hypothetical protein [Planctomycetota bacterium]